MRLIDADAYKEVFERNAWYYKDLGNNKMAKLNRELAESTDNRPTAYDIDKVVEQLEELSKYEVVEKKFEKAIEIVKGGLQ